MKYLYTVIVLLLTLATESSGLSAASSDLDTKSRSTHASLSARLAVTPSSGTAALTVRADGTGSKDTNGSIVSYSIDFGDGTVVDSSSASHTYLYAGIYPVTLTVEDNNNATSSTIVPVAINQPRQGSSPYVPPVGIPTPSFGINEAARPRPAPWTSEEPLYIYVDPTDVNCTDVKQPPPFTGTPSTPRCTIPAAGLDSHFSGGLPAGTVVELHTSAHTCLKTGMECTPSQAKGTPWCYMTDHESSNRRRILVQGAAGDPVFIRGQDNSANEPTLCMPNGLALYGSYAIVENLKADQSRNVLLSNGLNGSANDEANGLFIGVSEQDTSCARRGCGAIHCPNSGQVMCADHIVFRHLEGLNSDSAALGDGKISNDLCTNNNANCPGFQACVTFGGGWFGKGKAGDRGVRVPAGANEHDIVFWDINLHDQGQMNPRTFAAQNGCSGIQIQRDMSNVWVLYSKIHNIPQNGITTTGCDGGACQNDIHHVYFGGNDVSMSSKSCFVAKASHDVIFSQNSCHDVYPTDCDVSTDPLGIRCAPSTGLSMLYGPQNVWFILNSVWHVLWGVNESDPDVGTNTGHYYLGNVFTAISDAYDVGPTGVLTHDEIGFMPSNNSVGNAPEAFRVSQAFADIHIVNNTIDDMTAANGVGEAGGGGTFGPNSEIVNNIFANRGTNMGFDIVFEGATAWNNTKIDYNYFFSTQPNFLNVDNLNGASQPYTKAGSTLGGKCLHCFDSGKPPNFTNAAQDDTHLTPTSPMRNACMSTPPAYETFRKLYGLSIATDRDGQARPLNNGWSCGAYN